LSDYGGAVKLVTFAAAAGEGPKVDPKGAQAGTLRGADHAERSRRPVEQQQVVAWIAGEEVALGTKGQANGTAHASAAHWN
jgi:hypothetical protein